MKLVERKHRQEMKMARAFSHASLHFTLLDP